MHRRIVSSLVVLGISVGGCGDDGDRGPVSGAATSSPQPADEQPESSAHAREDYEFVSLPAMIDASTIVVEATVTNVERGRVVGPPEDPIQFRELTLQVDRVLRGELATNTLRFEEEGWTGEDLSISMSVNHSRWANAGDRAIWFLVDKGGSESGIYRLLNTQARFFLLGDDRVRGNRVGGDPVGRAAERLGEQGLRQAVAG